jgi:hypothetical protein
LLRIGVMDHHSLIGHTAYTDLLRNHLDEEVGLLRGTVERKAGNGRTYLYDRYRIGTKVVSRYIGEATDQLNARIARADELRARTDERRKTRTRLVRLLRSEGYQGLDTATGSLLAAMARIGVFRLGGTLVGTMAFRLYEGDLGVRIGTTLLAQTDDIDIASFERLSLALNDTVTEPVSDALSELEFSAVPNLNPRQTWKWADANKETLVGFLTPGFGDEGIRDLPALGVSAQDLHHLNYLIADPIPAVALYRSGVLLQIPRPEHYAIHKLIVADRRKTGTDSLKARKDRAQAEFLIEVPAEDRPDELRDAYQDAQERGPKWRARIKAFLGRMPQTQARLLAL